MSAKNATMATRVTRTIAEQTAPAQNRTSLIPTTTAGELRSPRRMKAAVRPRDLYAENRAGLLR